ncbi:MAG: hypothetical protein ACLRIO_08250, partial [Butyricicoccus sp.]
SRPSGCDTSKLLSDDLKNKLYYDGFQKMLYHYSHHAKPFFRWKERLFCNLFGVFKILKTALKSKLKQNGCLSMYREASVFAISII